MNATITPVAFSAADLRPIRFRGERIPLNLWPAPVAPAVRRITPVPPAPSKRPSVRPLHHHLNRSARA